MTRQILRTIGVWLESRLGLRATLMPILRHPVPRGSRWWYVFGSATLTMFLLQVVTGICLSLVYVPSAGQAYESLQYLTYQQYLGWFVRALHNTAASGMVVLLAAHMTQVFLMGGFKYPREMTWLVGVLLLVLTLGMAFTGQVLRWDQDAYWGVGVAASMAGRVPIVGPSLVHLLLGGPTIGGDTLSRFFALHVFILPALILLSLVVHLYLVVRLGVSEPPVAGRLVSPVTYAARYQAELRRGEPFFPAGVMRDLIASSLAVIVVVVLAAVLGPSGPGLPPDPTLIAAEPRPDWYFLPLFALLAISPRSWETAIMLGLPLVVLAVLIAIPFVAGKGERSPRRRPVAVLSVVVMLVCYGTLVWVGYAAPWSPDMHAWSGTPVPPRIVERLSPVQLQGAIVFQNKTCRNCHALDGQGGRRGPDLTLVATRMDHAELMSQVLNGSENMPKFAKQLSPAEMTALLSFLETLEPAGEPAARATQKK